MTEKQMEQLETLLNKLADGCSKTRARLGPETPEYADLETVRYFAECLLMNLSLTGVQELSR